MQSLQKFNSAIKVTNDGLTKSQRITKAWNENMTGCSMAAKRMGNDLITGKKKISDVSNSMKTATASTKALGVAMNVFANVGFMLAITAVTKVVTELAQAQSKAVEAAHEATESYKEELVSLEDYKTKISELHEELNSENISYKDSKTIREELLTLQDELIKKYGNEKTAIENITTAIKGEVNALDELNEKAYRDWVAKADKRSGWNKLLPWGQSGLDQAIDYMETEKTVSFFDMSNANSTTQDKYQAPITDEIRSIQEEIDKTIQSKYNLEKEFATFKLTGTPEEIKSQLEAIRQDYLDLSKEAFLENGISSEYWEAYRSEAINSINEVINKFDDGLKKHQETYQTYIEGMIKYDSEYSDEYANILQKRAALESAENSGNADDIRKARQEFMDAINNGIQSSGSDENIKKYFESLYPELQAEFVNWNFEVAINANTDELADKAKEIGEKYSATDLLDMVNTEGTQEGEESFNKLIDKAIEYGVCTDKSAEEVQKLIDLLVELGIVQDNVQGSTLNESIDLFDVFSLKDADNETTLLSNLKDKLSDVKSAYETCLAAKEEYDEQGYLSIDTLQKVISLGDEYLQYLFDEQGNVKLDTEAFKQLSLARINDMEAQALQNLAENIQQITDEATATEYLTQKQNKLANSYVDVAASALMALSSIDGFTDSNALQGAYNSFKTQYEQIKSLFASTRNGLGKTFTGISDSAKSKAEKAAEDATQKAKSYIESYMDFQKKSLELGKIDYNTYCNTVSNLLKSMFKDGKIAAKDYHDYTKQMLEVQKSIYDKVISAVVRRIEKEIQGIQDIIDGLQKQNDALEKQKDEYDSILSVVDSVYEKQIQALEDEKQLLQDKIDQLQDESDAYDLIRKKEEALYALRRAESQRTKKVFNGTEFVYDTDQSAIRDAKQNLQDIETEELVNQLEKEQEVIQESIDTLEEYRQKWKEITDFYDTETSIQLAIMLWGKDYEKIILSNRLSDIENFKDKYISTQKQIDDNQSTIESFEEKKEIYEGLKKQWSDISDAYEQSQEDQYAAMLMGQNWEADVLSGRLDKLNDFKSNYIEIQRAIADEAWKSANEQIKAAQEAEKGVNGTIHNNSQNVNYTDYSTATDAVKAKEKDDLAKQIENAQIKLSEARTALSKAPDNTARASKQKLVNYYETLLKDLNIRYSKYATGTPHAQRGLHLVSEEEYGDEIILPNDGSAVLAKGEQLYPFKGGETVIKASETEKILANMGNLVPIETDEIWKKFADNMPDLSSMVKLDIPDYSKLGEVVSKSQIIEQHNQFNVSLPNITDNTKATEMFKDFQRLTLDAYQYANTRKK